MSRRRFFVPEIRRNTAELTGPDAEHLVRVLRAEVGQVHEISDNSNLYLAEITTARKSQIEFTIIEQLAPPAPEVRVTLLPALIKFDRFEWLLEKATELGADAIQPIEAARSERGLAKASQKRLPRWEKIAQEASQQSRRVRLPVIGPAVRLEVSLAADANVGLFLDESAETPLLLQLPPARSTDDRVALLLGPEGGWTDEERRRVLAAGWLPCSLGQTILRTETAAVAGLAIVKAAWELSRNAPVVPPPAGS